jgi:outer membrane protein assembly factor BamA
MPHGCLAVLLSLINFAVPVRAAAQDQVEDWEGKVISVIATVGFDHENVAKNIGRTPLMRGIAMTREKRTLAIKELVETGNFKEVDIKIKDDQTNPGKVIVTVIVVEKESPR